MKNIKKIYLFILILALAFIFSTIFSLINLFSNTITSGVYISGIDVSNLSKEEANTKLLQYINIKTSSNLNINFLSQETGNIDYNTYISLDSLNITYDISKAIEMAYNIGRSGNIFNNNYEILNTFIRKKYIEIDFSLDEKILDQEISKIDSELPNKLVQSSYYIEDNNLIILKGSSGNHIDKNNLKKQIYSAIINLTTKENTINSYLDYISPTPVNLEKIYNQICTKVQNAYYEKDPFKVYPEIIGIDFDIDTAENILNDSKNEYIIPLTITYPEITIDKLEINFFPDLLGYFSTKYDLQNKNRATNLALATSKINGTIILPGKEFSYNSIVGARTIDAGYKESKIYSNGQVVDGIGGGICQISSTLYNTALFASLEITERHNHQFITSYVSPGRDATVVYGSKDLKFLNNRTYPIKIIATASDGIVKISIYGIKENAEYDISFDTETISTIPYTTKYEYNSSLNSSEEILKQLGANGAIINSYKVVKLNGSIVSRTLISHDTYNALNRLIETGNSSKNLEFE